LIFNFSNLFFYSRADRVCVQGLEQNRVRRGQRRLAFFQDQTLLVEGSHSIQSALWVPQGPEQYLKKTFYSETFCDSELTSNFSAKTISKQIQNVTVTATGGNIARALSSNFCHSPSDRALKARSA